MLVLTSLTKSLNKTYILHCTVIQVEARVEPELPTYEEGSDITLTCIIVNPQPNVGYIYRWSRKGDSLPDSAEQQEGKLLLGPAAVEKEGVYVVVASDGNSEAKVEVPVQINRKPSEFKLFSIMSPFCKLQMQVSLLPQNLPSPTYSRKIFL